MIADLTTLVWGALMPGITAHHIEPWVHRALSDGVNTVCLFEGASGSPQRTLAIVQQLRAVSNSLLITVDEEGGDVTRLQSRTGSSFLSPSALGFIADPEVTRASGRLIGDMLKNAGVDWNLGPVADVNVDPRNPVIGLRSFGEDAVSAAIHVGAFITGIQSTGVIATAKHFPGHGDTPVDSHESLPTVSVTLDLLRQRELLPFRSAIGAGVRSVMTGHLLVTSVDSEAPASLSRAITTNLLRGELGYKGVVVTDALDMGAISRPFGQQPPHAAVASLLAGADLVCLGSLDQKRAIEAAANAIFQALSDGTLEPAVLVAAAERRAQLITRRRDTYQHSDVERDETILADAAERSLLAHGDVTLSQPRVDVLRLGVSRGSAIDAPPWSVGRHLLRFGLDVRIVDTVATRSDRDLVIEVRDAWTSADLLRSLSEVARARPDAVIVDVGTPTPDLPKCRGSLMTHGIGNLSMTLAACRLTGRDPRPFVMSILDEARVSASFQLPTRLEPALTSTPVAQWPP
ncbi:MAG: glycoside hydrolase family 3 N-terminal domain-containing protein [Planctomycetota bacterium]